MSVPETDPQAPLVLVVDDYFEARDICAEYLSFHGYRVVTAEDGAEAMDKAFALLPDVILMDLSLPEVDGWVATRRLKDDPRTAEIPIVALTAHALSSERDRALAAGCDDVITKPCAPSLLLAEVERQLARRRGSEVVEEG
jgi:CheY-like chemotaxis protein